MITPHKLLAGTTFTFMVLYLATRLSGCVLAVEVEAPKDPVRIDHRITLDGSVAVTRPDGGLL